MMDELSVIFSNIPLLLSGLIVTIELLVGALTVGLILAAIMTLCCISEKPWLKIPVQIFIFIIRGTPLLVQVFLIYYGSGQFEWIRETSLWIVLKEPFACAIVALAINSSAYTTEIFLGAIRTIPRGEVEAGLALGMPWFTLIRRIIAPRAMRIVLPAYSNEVIMLIKASSLASTITIMDLMGVTQQLISQTYIVIEFYCVAGIIYLALNTFFMWIFQRVERRWNVYLG